MLIITAVDVTVSLASYILRNIFSWFIYLNIIFTRPGKQKNTKSLHLLLSEILFQEKKFFQQKCIIFIFTLNKDTITLQ